MDKNFLKKITPYLVAIIVFVVITIVYFSPLLEGKKLKQHDIAMFKGMSKEISDFREKTGEEALWTNSMFGGMPAWQISVQYNGNLTRFIDKVVTLGLPSPANYVFLYFLGFFVLLLVLRVDPWISLVGAIAYALSSYFFIILGAGHTSKAHAIGYMALVMAGIILTFRGKYWQGALLTAVSLALEIKAGHLQITYYLLMIVVMYGFYQLIVAIKEKQYTHFLKVMGFLAVAAILAASTHITNLWATYDYGKETMRGKPELTKDIHNKSGGLDRDYITNWSYGKAESWSLMIPNVKGGASGTIGNISALEKADPGYRNAIAGQNHYWGDQPGTSGPVYVGVIVIFLFILGLFTIKDKIKWVLLAVTVLSILLAWGRNFMPFTDFFIDYIPSYNKFRAVSMTLVMAELAIPMLAFLALNKLVTEPALSKNNLKALYISFGLTGGLILIFFLAPTTFFSFFNENEMSQFNELLSGPDSAQVLPYMNSMEAVRVAIFKTDALRSLFFVILGAGLVYFFTVGKIKKGWLIGGMAFLMLIDMVSVNRRYLNNDNFVKAKQADVPFKEAMVNKEINKDTDPDFRVLDLTNSTFNDASASYFHKSIGGYHGAKLLRYQDLIDEYLQPEIMSLYDVLKGAVSQTKIDETLKSLQAMNMLNMKYIMISPDSPPIPNRFAFGHAWFVDQYQLVDNADQEIAALSKQDLLKVAVIDQKFSGQISGKSFQPDPNASASLVSYSPNKLEYYVKTNTEQILIFSQIYYNKGWNAYLNGQKVPHFRVNYVLRAMVVPAGEHEIVFKFEPKIWVIGEKISFASSLLLILLVIGALAFELKNYFTKKQT